MSTIPIMTPIPVSGRAKAAFQVSTTGDPANDRGRTFVKDAARSASSDYTKEQRETALGLISARVGNRALKAKKEGFIGKKASADLTKRLLDASGD